MQALKKITVAAINGKRGGFTVKEDDADKVIARIYGRADNVAAKASNYGDYLQFSGSIKAINADREDCFSSVLILPSPADTMLAEALKNDTEKMGVTFAFDIVLRAMPKKNPTDRGYQFIVKPLMESKSDDPLKALADSLPPLAALPAPTEKQEALPLEEKKVEPEPTKAEHAPTKKK